MIYTIGIIIVLGSIVPPAYNWDNAWDQPFTVACISNDWSISSLNSIHSNSKEDRLWNVKCWNRIPGNTYKSTRWTGYVNDWDKQIWFFCNNDEVISGMGGIHDNNKEDRRYQFRCTKVLGYTPHSCRWSGWLNDYDQPINYNIPSGYYLRGVNSYHDNNKEDRKFDLYICKFGRLLSCPQVQSCSWNSWGPWTTHVNLDNCGNQYRERRTSKTLKYVNQYDTCSGINANCNPNYLKEHRMMCNCKTVDTCTLGQWSVWSPKVQNGKCATQTRYQDKILKSKFVMQINNCNGLQKTCQNPRVVDTRIYCMCPYKDCSKYTWSGWKPEPVTGNLCPVERKYKIYTAAIVYKEGFGDCQSVKPSICLPTSEQRKKDVKCPKLSIPINGIHLNPACNGINSGCNKGCTIKCNKGYRLKGLTYSICQPNNTWSGTLGHCQDMEKPFISCPNIGNYENVNTKNYSVVNLPQANASDSTGIIPKVITNIMSPFRAFVGETNKVIYTAIDAAGNNQSCSISITVQDTEPPRIIRCPENQIIKTGKRSYQVIWKTPTFIDNVDGKHINIISSHQNGVMFPKGIHHVKYLARDNALNSVTCTFTIQIEEMSCRMYDPPKHGSLMCNYKHDGKIKNKFCTVSCNKDYWFMTTPDMPSLYHYYACNADGRWNGQNYYNGKNKEFFTSLPDGKSPWPDCSAGKPPDAIAMDFQVNGGSCKKDENIKKLKQNFIKSLTNDLIMSMTFCRNTNCKLDNLVVKCGNRKRRRTGVTPTPLLLKFTISVDTKAGANESMLQSEVKALNNEKLNISNKIKTSVSVILNETVNISAESAKLSCPDGFEFRIVIGTATNESKCVQCPRGTYYDKDTQRCTACQIGFYQGLDGAMACNKCPNGSTTDGPFAYNVTQCKGLCKAGTYSSTGLSTCIACPIETYQSNIKSNTCTRCANDTTTLTVGAISKEECIPRRELNIAIRSEGCGDRSKTSICGTSTIIVEGMDYSQHKRGYNFVVLDVYTGKYLQSNAFDWYDDSAACNKTLKWISDLAEDVIVLAAIQDEATAKASQDCFKALEMIGGRKPFQRQYRASFAMIGYKGSRTVTWVQQKMSNYGAGPTEIKQKIKLL